MLSNTPPVGLKVIGSRGFCFERRILIQYKEVKKTQRAKISLKGLK
jgi:hypothetical protein